MDDPGTRELWAFLSAATACAGELLDNANYVLRQLPALAVSDAQHAAIHELCQTWFATKHDVVVEIADARDMGEPPASPMMRARVRRIVEWLGEDVAHVDAVVALLDPQRAADRGHEEAFVLVAESGGNIFTAIARVRAAADRYATAIG